MGYLFKGRRGVDLLVFVYFLITPPAESQAIREWMK
jgi:hypothetical protein